MCWLQDVSNRSFKSSTLQGGQFVQHILQMLHSTEIGKSGGPVNQTISCGVVWRIILLKEATASGNIVCMYMVCNYVWVGGTCQSNINVNGRTQAEHWLKHRTGLDNLPSFHSASSGPSLFQVSDANAPYEIFLDQATFYHFRCIGW